MLKPLDNELARPVRDLFAESGYTREGMKKSLLYNELPSASLRSLPRLLDRTREPTLPNLLLRLFAFGLPESETAVRALAPEWFLAAGFDSGLLASDGDRIRSTAMLAPFDGLLIATDHARKIEAADDPNTVLLINPTTWILRRFSIRRPSEATLDLGAGCGALALAASSYSRSVVATDLNPRCTEFARFNTALNGVENVDCLTGNAFEPVAGRRFDSILTNPPFFITPAMDHLFCDNEMELDGFCRQLIRQAPSHLVEGGYLQMVCEWVGTKDQDWRERISEWVRGIGCDAFVLRGHQESPEKYASNRIRETTAPSPEADVANYQAWTAFYREKGVVAIHRGLIALRRRSGHNWIRFDEVQGIPHHPFGDAILQQFAIQDLLAAEDPEARLLSTRLEMASGVRLTRSLRDSGDGWRIHNLHLTRTEGIPYRQKTEPLVAEYLSLFDGRTPVGEAIDRLATRVEAPSGEVRRECLAITGRLLTRGFLKLPEARP